jgi:DNA invertase Pin-like site-specific DNA recombinase
VAINKQTGNHSLVAIFESGEKRAGFKSLRDTWADTTTAHGRLMLTVLGDHAEFERELGTIVYAPVPRFNGTGS